MQRYRQAQHSRLKAGGPPRYTLPVLLLISGRGVTWMRFQGEFQRTRWTRRNGIRQHGGTDYDPWRRDDTCRNRLLAENQISELPVVDHDGRLAGMSDITNLIEWRPPKELVESNDVEPTLLPFPRDET